MVASLVVECGLRHLRHTGSVVVAHELGRSTACGIVPDQGSNPCPWHWQVDSQPLDRQESPVHPVMSLCRNSALSAGDAPPLEPLGKLYSRSNSA